MKEASVLARVRMCEQTLVQSHWMADCKMTILYKEILFDMLKKF